MEVTPEISSVAAPPVSSAMVPPVFVIVSLRTSVVSPVI
jgi:hypothetical protein